MNEIKVVSWIFTEKRLKFLLFIFLLIASQLQSIACDCDNPPLTFVNSLSTFTAEMEVIQIDTLSEEGVHKFRPLVLIKLKVVKLFNGRKDVKFVWMNNSSGPDCERGIFPDFIGQKYIITGRFYETKRYDHWIDDSSGRNFLYVTTCGKTVLDIEGNYVFGVITKNMDKKIKEHYDLLMQEDESKAKAYYEAIYNTKHHKDLVQKMPINAFYKLMKQ